MSEHSNSLVIDQQGNKVVVEKPAPFTIYDLIPTQEGFVRSYSMDNFQAYNALASAKNFEEYFKDEGGLLLLTGYFIDFKSWTSDNGEVFAERPFLYLFDDKGEAFVTLSSTLIDCFKRLVKRLGAPCTWHVPLPIIIKKKVRKSKIYFQLLIDNEKAAALLKGKK